MKLLFLKPEIHAALLIFSLSAGMTWFIRFAASRFGIVSAPRQERWHKKPTPLLGGIAIFLPFVLGFVWFVPKENATVWLVFCAAMVFLVGLVDDFRRLKPETKLIAQVVLSIGLGYYGLILPFTHSQTFNFLITVLWLVGITNAMNLLDNMDGLCAGITIIACVYRMLFCLAEEHTAGVMLALILMSAVAGFLVFNFNPASIFMGDSGSLLIGFLLAGISIVDTHASTGSILSVLVFPLLILIIPIFDTILVTINRKFSGRPISLGGKDHSSHRLVAIGLSERRAVLILYGVASVSGYIAYSLYLRGFSKTIFFIGVFIIGMVLFGAFLSKIKIYGEERIGSVDERLVFRLVSDIPRKKYLFLVLLDLYLIVIAYYGSYWLRFDGIEPGEFQFRLFLNSFPVVMVFSIVSLFVFGLYRRHWRYTGIEDLLVMIKGTGAGVVATVLLLTYLYRFEGYSRSVFVVYGGTLIMFLAGSRLSFRILTEVLARRPEHHKKVLLYGAGDGGELFLRELQNNQARESLVVGFLDDDVTRIKTRIHGVPVLGDVRTADFWIRKHSISQIIISSHKIPSEKVAQLQEVCDRFGVELLRASMRFERAAI